MKLLLILLFTFTYSLASQAFISAKDLAKLVGQENLVLIDTTDADTYNESHIKGAFQVEISKFRHKVDGYQLMNSSNEIEALIKSLGITKDSHVVLYGHNKPKELLKCSYIALAFILNGLENVSILDGGYQAFEYDFADLTSTKPSTPIQSNFKASFDTNVLVDLNYTMNKIGKVPMIEARPIEFFTGEKQSSGVKRLGHIKGAQSSNWRDKFNSDDSLKSNQDLEKIFYSDLKLNKDKEVIAYCTGGLEASMNWYILTQHLNFKNVKLYDASMRQWGNLDYTPMEK